MGQEIVLSSNAVVLCGANRVDWDSFQKAARLVMHCKFLQKGKQNYLLLLRIIFTAYRRTQGLSPRFLPLLIQFMACQASGPRDLVFGLLGMYKPESEADTIRADYTKSTAEVFQEVTELMVVKERNLYLWRYLNLEPSIREDSALPSWVPYYNASNLIFIMPVLAICGNTTRLSTEFLLMGTP